MKTEGWLTWPIRFVILSLAVSSSPHFSRGCPPGPGESCRWKYVPDSSTVGVESCRGKYSNPLWEFEVTIPTGFTGYSSSPPAPQHGVGMWLGPVGGGYLWTNGEWNSLEYESSESAARLGEWDLRSRGAEVESVTVKPWVLDGRPASRINIRFRCPGGEEVYVREEVVALSPSGSKVWTVGLDTLWSRYSADARVFEKILSSWRLRVSANR